MDIAEGIAFYVIGALTIGAALLVVSLRNIFHAVLALVVAFVGIAGLYITLNAGFLATVQVLIYAGAIAILTLFAVFMTRNAMTQGNPPGRLQGPAFVAALLMFIAMTYVFVNSAWGAGSGTSFGAAEMAASLFGPFAFPFELASVLLLIAMVGAIVISRE